MSETIIIKPLEWYPDTLMPKDRALFDAIQDFLVHEFGERHNNLGQFSRVFASVRENGQVNGLAGTVARMDVPLFHVGQPHAGQLERAETRDALAASELLYTRLKHYLEDIGGKGYDTFVYVAPETRERWAKFLERHGLREAHRWVITI